MRRIRWIGAAVLLIVCGLAWFNYRADRQSKLDLNLLVASEQADSRAVRFWLAQGADPNAREETTRTPGWKRLIDFLLQNRRRRGTTPLSKALPLRVVDEHHFEVVQALLEHGANPNLWFPNRRPLLLHVFAIMQLKGMPSDNRLLTLFLQHGANPNTVDMSGNCPLMFAVTENKDAWARALLEHGARADSTGPHGETPLMLAAHRANRPLIESLLAHGADVDKRDSAGQTALLYSQSGSAVGAEYDGTVEMLLNAGANVNDQDMQGCSPFLFALIRHSSSLPAMLAHGASPHTTVPLGAVKQIISVPEPSSITGVSYSEVPGTTALMLAAHWKDAELVRTLLTKGGDVRAKNTAGRSALDFAASDPQICSLLQSAALRR